LARPGADTASAQAKQTTPEKSLYERLGGVFAIAAVVDHFSDAVVKNPIVGQNCGNGTPRIWEGCPASSLCGRCGSVTFRVGRTSSRPPSPGRRRSALRRPLREWHTKNLGRLPGLKFMRTLWVCDVSGGPYKFKATKPRATPLGLEEAHRDLRISPEEFDEVAAELGRTLDFFKVPKPEKTEVLAAFAAHKGEVTAGYVENPKRG
jgi:hemoglobin